MIERIQGDSRRTLQDRPDGSVHCSVSSPPYWQLRSYLKKDDPLKPLEIGCEPTPGEYIQNLMDVYDQVKRVLRDDGTVWVNIGDTYNAGRTGGWAGGLKGISKPENAPDQSGVDVEGMVAGNLVGIPFLFVQAMQAHGWIHRDTIIWQKTCAMPSSVNGWRWEKHRVKIGNSDRCGDASKDGSNGLKPHAARKGKDFVGKSEYVDCPGCSKCSPNGGLILRKGSWRTTTAHEYIFMFAKTDEYFCDAYAVRTPAKAATVNRNNYTRIVDDPDEQFAVQHDHEFTGLTANLRSVWEIGPEPLGEKHYAAYPSEIPRRIIKAATSENGCCRKCGSPWTRVVERPQSTGALEVGGKMTEMDHNHSALRLARHRQAAREAGGDHEQPFQTGATIGWRPSCTCNAGDPVPCVVLDPFGGSGRTGITAQSLNRDSILCELNPEYMAIQDRQIERTVGLFAA